MTSATGAAVDNVVARLDKVAVAKTKAWWERYLKGEIEFRGVPMAGIRKSVHVWHDEADPDPVLLKDVALSLLRQPVAENKLAGILIFQELDEGDSFRVEADWGEVPTRTEPDRQAGMIRDALAAGSGNPRCSDTCEDPPTPG